MLPDKKLRIMFIDHGAKLVGGGQVNTLSLIRCMNKEIFEPVIVTSTENTFTAEAQTLGIRVDVVPFPTSITEVYRTNVGRSPLKLANRVVGLLGVVWRLSRYISANRVDLVHPCDNISRIAGGVAARITGRPAVCHITDDLENTLVNGVLRRFIYWGMDLILPVSYKVAEFFKSNKHYAEKVKVVYTGIDLEYFAAPLSRDDARKEFDFKDNELIIGIVGLLVPIKGHRELFRALAQLKGISQRRYRCLVVGDGPDKEYLKDMALELGIEKEVVFSGFSNNVPRLLAGIDVLAVPSHTEASSRVVLEAGAMGIPSVGTRIGGIPEMIEEGVTGLLVPLGDIEAFVDALLQLEDEKLRSKMGEQAKIRVYETFCNKKITAQVENMYLTVIANHSSEIL